MALHQSSDSDGRVIRFRARRRGWKPVSPVPDLSKFERGESEDDYRHRMRMNVLGFAAAAVLVLTGLWLVSMMVDTEAAHPQHRPEGAGYTLPPIAPGPHAPSISPAASPG